MRGITRNVGSAAAKELSALGVEMVEADMYKKDTLIKAFNGCWGLFAMSQFFGTKTVLFFTALLTGTLPYVVA